MVSPAAADTFPTKFTLNWGQGAWEGPLRPLSPPRQEVRLGSEGMPVYIYVER